MKRLLWVMLLFVPLLAQASPDQVYHQALQLSSGGEQVQAIERLRNAAKYLPDGHVWQQRMTDAAILIEMKQRQYPSLPESYASSMNLKMVQAYINAVELPEREMDWTVGVLATVLPGAGHAWLDRWNDALVAALMVWPMLLLSIWAFVRRMGPVTVFFGMITVWVWSGTVFSTISLAERSNHESYLIWWQALWQASALPGMMP